MLAAVTSLICLIKWKGYGSTSLSSLENSCITLNGVKPLTLGVMCWFLSFHHSFLANLAGCPHFSSQSIWST